VGLVPIQVWRSFPLHARHLSFSSVILELSTYQPAWHRSSNSRSFTTEPWRHYVEHASLPWSSSVWYDCVTIKAALFLKQICPRKGQSEYSDFGVGELTYSMTIMAMASISSHGGSPSFNYVVPITTMELSVVLRVIMYTRVRRNALCTD
jgi:hypothetical protein